MRARIYFKVFLLVLLSGVIFADKEHKEDFKDKVDRKAADDDQDEQDDIESQESKQPVQPIAKPTKLHHKLQAAAGFINPVALNYGGGYQGGKVQVQKVVYEPKPYRFGYEIKDPNNGKSFRHEEDDGSGAKKGSYGYRDPYGLYRIVEYVADHNGFRAAIRTNEPGTASQNPAYVNIVSEYQPVIGGHGGKQGRAVFGPSNIVLSGPKIPAGAAPIQAVKFIPPPPPPQPVRFVPQPPQQQLRFIQQSQQPIRFVQQPPQQVRFVPQPPQQIKFVQTAPQPVKLVPQQQIRFAPPRQQVRFVHQQPQQLAFGPPRPLQFVARSPAQLAQQQLYAPRPAHILNHRPEVQLRQPVIFPQQAPQLRPILQGPHQVIKPLPSAPVQIGGFHNPQGLRPIGPPQQLLRPNGGQLINIQHGPRMPIINEGGPSLALRPIHTSGPVINHGPINGPIISRGPIRIHQGTVGGLHVAAGPTFGPIVHQIPEQNAQFHGQNIPIRGDVGSLKITAGAPIVSGPGVGNVYVQQQQKVEGLTRNVMQGIAGGIRNGLRSAVPAGSIVAAPIRLYKGFREGLRNGFNQGLKGAHSGENNEGQQVVEPPKKPADQTIFVGPFPGRHQGREISHIVMSKVQDSESRQYAPNSHQERTISRVVVTKVEDSESSDSDESESRKPVEVPGGEPAYIGPGPAPKFEPSEIKKKTPKTKPRRQQHDKKRRKPKPTTLRPRAERLTEAPSNESPTRSYSYPPSPPRRPTIDIEFTIPFGK